MSARSSNTRRFLSLWFSQFALNRLTRQLKASGTPVPNFLVTFEKSKSALRLASISQACADAGLCVGLSLADARARMPELTAVAANHNADSELLRTIAEWCLRFTPIVVVKPPESLILDITGCAHLFGGEPAMKGEIVDRLTQQGFCTFASIAETPVAALALVWSKQQTVLKQGEAIRAIPKLPLAALGLETEQLDKLKRAGFCTIADLAERPRAPLAARFGKGLLDILDKALGKDDEGLTPHRPLPAMVVEQRFAEPMLLESSILKTIGLLAERIEKVLVERGEGARVLEALVFRVDGVMRQVNVQAGQPVAEAKLITKLFSQKLSVLNDEWNVGYGFDLVQLCVLQADKINQRQKSLDAQSDDGDSLSELVDQLGARVGHKVIRVYEPSDSHLPESAARSVAAITGGKRLKWAKPGADVPARPLTYFHPPEPIEAIAEVPDGPPIRFKWRKSVYQVAKAEGPERIADEWWQQDRLTRDYFRVEDSQGHRFWLYREGMYFETQTPRWFMQGLFA